MTYVIKGGARGWYVAVPGQLGSYTPKLERAWKFPNRDEAERNKCGNEAVLTLEQAAGGRVMRKSTPWGEADTATVLAEGIISYGTPSHGGIWISAARRAALCAAVPGVQCWNGPALEWWEEDCDWSVPFWFFREDIRAAATGWEAEHFAKNLQQAEWTIREYHKECAEVLLTAPAPRRAPAARQLLLDEAAADAREKALS